jgi:hypothetical protein
LFSLINSLPGLELQNGLLYLNNRLVIPRAAHLRETIFCLAHDDLGHFGLDKSYAAIRESYYWPNMRRDLEDSYIPGCPDCARNKSRTTKPPGPLHPLPIPDHRGDSVAIDFIGPLPPEQGFNGIMTMTDRLGADIHLVPCHMNMKASKIANLFFDHWYCENGLPLNIVSDRDKWFTGKFWRALHRMTGIRLKMSTSFHLQTDGSSERTNKTINQALRFFVDRHQKGWVNALPRVRFNLTEEDADADTNILFDGADSVQKLTCGYRARNWKVATCLKPITPHKFLERLGGCKLAAYYTSHVLVRIAYITALSLIYD